jgi:AcrR family transcriptional regulator
MSTSTSTTDTAPQAPETMSANQLARRARLLDAVIDLVADGADEDVQMKDIAEHAGVALGTTYRYFSSKDHLIAAALLHWARGLDQGVSRRAPRGTPAERLTAALHQALVAYQRRPAFARLLVLVANSTDPNASACYADMGPVVFGALGQVIADVDPERRERVMHVIGAVWYHCFVEWTIGRMSLDQVDETLESACHLVLPD